MIHKVQMKIFFRSVLICILFSCNMSSDSSLRVSLSQGDFTEAAQDDILEIVGYFENKISTDSMDLQRAYEAFLMNSEDMGNLENMFTYQELGMLFKGIDEETKMEIWSTADAKAYTSSDGEKYDEFIPYQSIGCSWHEGDYIEWLYLFAKDDKRIDSYVESISKEGSFPPMNTILGLVFDEHLNTIDLKDPRWRIIISVNVVSAMEDWYRYKYLIQDPFLKKNKYTQSH